MSLPRFLLVLFPLFIWLGAWLAEHPAPGGRCSAARPLLMVALRRPVRDLALGGVKTSPPTPGEASPGEGLERTDARRSTPAPAAPATAEPLEGDRARSPQHELAAGGRPVALLGAFVLTTIGVLAVDLPAVALGVEITSSHTPAGPDDRRHLRAGRRVRRWRRLICAHWVSREVRAWQFGLRRPGVGWGCGGA